MKDCELYMGELLKDDNILNIYHFGSVVYNTINEKSDSDFIVVCKKLPNGGELYNIDYYTFHFHTLKNFELLLELNEIQSLECIFLPNKFKIKETIKFPFVLDKEKLRRSVSTITSNSYVKGKKKLIIQGDYDKYLAIKSIFHSIRIIDFGIQIATENRIINYETCNWIMFDLLKISENKESVELWDIINRKYHEIFRNKSSDFKKLCPISNDKNITIKESEQSLIINGKLFKIKNSEDFETVFKIIQELDLLPIIKHK
jgi:hypothetical protein